MSSPASIAKHPIHSMLIAFPIGLWVFSLISDIIYLAGLGGLVWSDVAFYTMAGGLVGAILAAIPGLIDLVSISEPRVKKIGIWHMSINLIVVALFAASLWLRTLNPPGATVPFALSIVAVVLLAISGWLGGEMVYVHAVAVEPQRDTMSENVSKSRTPKRAA